jgi:hypothetical protein
MLTLDGTFRHNSGSDRDSLQWWNFVTFLISNRLQNGVVVVCLCTSLCLICYIYGNLKFEVVKWQQNRRRFAFSGSSDNFGRNDKVEIVSVSFWVGTDREFRSVIMTVHCINYYSISHNRFRASNSLWFNTIQVPLFKKDAKTNLQLIFQPSFSPFDY